MNGYNIIFDGENERIGFARSSCHHHSHESDI